MSGLHAPNIPIGKTAHKPTIGVIVATCDRPELLTLRSIPSILNQSLVPDFLVIVDDSHSIESQHVTAAYVKSLQCEGTVITLVSNRRTPGASGSWNTGIDCAFEQVLSPETTFLAILDDDDSWHPTYLEKCIRKVTSGPYDLVAADLSRIEEIGAPPLEAPGASSLNENDFLVGNPGVQASNLFLRLSTMLMAGCFDESLRSSTDRDLCIRLADLSIVRYARLPEPLVNHYAEPGRIRLTTRGSEAKISGLDTFWRKYNGRMTPSQRWSFSERAVTLFDWQPPSSASVFPDPSPIQRSPGLRSFATPWKAPEAPAHTPFRIVIGVITSEPNTVWPLLQSVSLQGIDAKVIILDNGCPLAELERITSKAAILGLNVFVFDIQRQQRDSKSGLFGQMFTNRPLGQVGIAQARTMIQRYLGREITGDPTAVGWLLDDVMRVDSRAKEYLRWLPALRESGVDVVLGSYEGSSPNPPLNGLRVQLVDLLHNIRWFDGLIPEQTLPDRSEENQRARREYPDYYYDLSRKHTAHLEQPHWVEPIEPNETVREALYRLLRDANRLMDGVPLTRPLTANTPLDPLHDARDSVNRGGCTFVLNPSALNLTPNVTIQINGREARRSDMIWAIVNRYYRKLVVKAVGFPVDHVARTSTAPGFNLAKVQGEIVGSAMYAGLTSFLEANPTHSLEFTDGELVDLQNQCIEQLHERLNRLEKSFFRIRGLLEALKVTSVAPDLFPLLSLLEQWFTEENWTALRNGVTSQNASELRLFLGSLREVANNYAAAGN